MRTKKKKDVSESIPNSTNIEPLDEIKEEMKNNRFVAIDFETLENWRCSVCEVGVVVIEDNKIVAKYGTKVCPPSMNESYHCVKTHGLHYNDVKGYPKFDAVWNYIDKEYIKGSPIIAHNVGFEKSCINECGDYYGTNTEYTYYDTLLLSRKYINKLYNYRLDTVSRFIHYKLNNHHNALEDALACANIFIYLNKKHKTLIEDYDANRNRRTRKLDD